MLRYLAGLSPALYTAALLLAPSIAQADEGMWTFNNFPAAKVGQAYGFSPDQKWLDHVRLSSIRLAQGCSASLVSKSGLVMTNHHCAHSCIEQLSTKDRDFVQTGFYAKDAKDEQEVPERGADAEEELGEEKEDGAGEDEVAGAESVEDGSNLQASEERKECVHAEDPPDGTGGGGTELVR